MKEFKIDAKVAAVHSRQIVRMLVVMSSQLARLESQLGQFKPPCLIQPKRKRK
jgi:hypothetical protein